MRRDDTYDPTDVKAEIARMGDEIMGNVRSDLEVLKRPDRSKLPPNAPTSPTAIPYGTAGRTRPVWEDNYRQLHAREPELTECRTPEHDHEAAEYLRAVVYNDQAKLREIADRPHNRAEAARWDDGGQRADLASGTIGSPGTGFGAVPIGFSATIETIMARASRLRPYINIVTGSTHATKIPVQTTKTVAAKHAENADMATGVTEPVYGSKTAEAVKLGALVKFSRELLDDSPVALINAVSRDIGEGLGTLEDASILDGTTLQESLFADLTPDGVLTWTDATETLTTLIAKYYNLDSVFRPRATWIINEAAAAIFAGLTGTGERQLFTEFMKTPSMIDDTEGQTGVLTGRPVLVFPTGTVPANEAIFGDLTGYTLYVREQLRAETSRESDFDTDQVAVRVSRRCDGVLSQAGRLALYG